VGLAVARRHHRPPRAHSVHHKRGHGAPRDERGGEEQIRPIARPITSR